MCEHKAAREALNAAAEALTAACRLICPDEIGKVLHKVYDDTVAEPVPDDLKQLVDRLQ